MLWCIRRPLLLQILIETKMNIFEQNKYMYTYFTYMDLAFLKELRRRRINHSINHSINQSIKELINQSVDQLINLSINQSIDQSIRQTRAKKNLSIRIAREDSLQYAQQEIVDDIR